MGDGAALCCGLRDDSDSAEEILQTADPAARGGLFRSGETWWPFTDDLVGVTAAAVDLCRREEVGHLPYLHPPFG